MHPAFSVIFLTTLIGAGQGLFIALAMAQVIDLSNDSFALGSDFFVAGGLLSLVFTALGLGASVFHLGHPERAWRAASQWRTSWLSREVIALPLFLFMTFLYTGAHFTGKSVETTLILALLGVIAAFALFICTSMIYQCLTFLREWHTPLTMINFTVFGTASGFVLATAFAAWSGVSELVAAFGGTAFILTVIGLISKVSTLRRNAALRCKQKTTVQTATGFHHTKVTQRSMGMMGGSYNTREFFHGQTERFVKNIKFISVVFSFVLPLVLLMVGVANESGTLLIVAFVLQYLGFVAERWYFFAMVNHPQNIYYQTVG